MTDTTETGREQSAEFKRRELLRASVTTSSTVEAGYGSASSGGGQGGAGKQYGDTTKSASPQKNCRTSNPVPIRATGKVSMKDIACGTKGVTCKGKKLSGSLKLTELAKQRGLPTPGGSVRDFALRELITDQTYSEPHVKSIRVDTNAGWANWLDGYRKTGLGKFKPKKADDVRQILLWAAENDKKIRAVGAGHSHSSAAAPQQNFVQLSWYKGKLSTSTGLHGLVGKKSERSRRTDNTTNSTYEASNFNANHLPNTTAAELDAVRVGAGETIKRLNRAILKPRKSSGLALLNMGSYDAQTMAGAINTSTHGTGIDFGTISDNVLAVEMATVMESPAVAGEPIVRKFRIEPTNGITDRSSFEDNIGSHGTTLIKDDQVFHAAVVGYGAMGIATSYTVMVRPRYFLKEEFERKDWKSLKSGWKNGNSYIDTKLSDNSIRHLSFLVNIPGSFKPKKKNKKSDPINPKCLVRIRKFRKWKSHQCVKNTCTWPPERRKRLGDIFRFIKRQTVGSGVDPKNPNPGLAGSIRGRWKRQQNNKPFEKTINSKNKDKSASYISLRRTRDKFHDKPAKPPKDPDPPSMTTEVAVPKDQLPAAVEKVIQKVRDVNDNQGIHFAGPLGVRFTAPSEHMLSPEYVGQGSLDRSNGVAMLEQTFPVGPVKGRILPGFTKTTTLAGLTVTILQAANVLPSRNISQQKMRKISEQALQPIEQALIDDHAGRPHMGKYNSLDRTELQNLYSSFDCWEGVYKEFNAFGTFNNKFTSKLGINV